MEASYPGELPRIELQVSNFKRRALKHQLGSAGNNLYFRPTWRREEVGKRFIRAFLDPAISLATEQQLLDLERFCCIGSNFNVLTVDPTFLLGDFDVTPTTYRHLLLRVSRTGTPLVMSGPIMTAKMLFSLVSMNKNLANIQAFGTDGEVTHWHMILKVPFIFPVLIISKI